MMLIAEEWRLVTSKLDFELQQLRPVTDKNGQIEKRWKFVGHYSGLLSAIKAIPDHVALREEVETLQDVIDELNKIAADSVRRLAK